MKADNCMRGSFAHLFTQKQTFLPGHAKTHFLETFAGYSVFNMDYFMMRKVYMHVAARVCLSN